MVIIWKGKGYLVFIIAFLTFLLVELVSEALAGDDSLYQESPFIMPFALVLAGLNVWLVGQRFLFSSNKKSRIDQEEKKEEEQVHGLFFIPYQYWPFILGIIGLCSLIYRLL